MNRLISILLVLCPFIVFGQSTTDTKFIGPAGNYLVNDSKVIFTNATTADQTLFVDTIPAMRLTENREYQFFSRLYLTASALGPSLTFKISLGNLAPITFVSNAGMLTGANNTAVLITGTIVKQPGSTYTLVEFNLQQPSGTVLNLTSSNVAEAVDVLLDNSVAVPLKLTLAFNSGGNNAMLIKRRLRRPEF